MTQILWLLIAFLPQQSDWPQWGGSGKNFRVDMLVDDVEVASPLTEVWKANIGEGYSGVVVGSGKVVTQARDGDRESIIAFDIEDGHEIWRTTYEAPPLGMMISRYGFGPHSTPCIANGMICSVGGTGIVRSTDLASGKTNWTRNLWSEFEATKLERGYSSSPVYFEGKFILPVGGQGTGIVAFDAKTGEEVWRSTDCEAAYTTPVIATLADQPQLICLMANELVSLNPVNGKVLWRYDYKPTNTVHVASPLALSGDQVLVVSSNLATLLRIREPQNDSASVEKVWESRRMTFQVGNVIELDDQLIGPSSTTSSAVLTSINMNDGQRLWRSRISGIGFLYKADDGFIAISDDGEVSLNKIVNGTPSTWMKYENKFNGRIWNAAAFVKDIMLVRDSNQIFALRFPSKKK